MEVLGDKIIDDKIMEIILPSVFYRIWNGYFSFNALRKDLFPKII